MREPFTHRIKTSGERERESVRERETHNSSARKNIQDLNSEPLFWNIFWIIFLTETLYIALFITKVVVNCYCAKKTSKLFNKKYSFCQHSKIILLKKLRHELNTYMTIAHEMLLHTILIHDNARIDLTRTAANNIFKITFTSLTNHALSIKSRGTRTRAGQWRNYFFGISDLDFTQSEVRWNSLLFCHRRRYLHLDVHTLVVYYAVGCRLHVLKYILLCKTVSLSHYT